LINKDVQITNEAYSVQGVEYDRHELRKLVRKVHFAQKKKATDEEEEEKKKRKQRSGLRRPSLVFSIVFQRILLMNISTLLTMHCFFGIHDMEIYYF